MLNLRRVSMLATAERPAAGLHVHNRESYLFLRLFTKEIR